ncbi:MAG: hypothetical protein HC824_09130 [Synechococcales cyanobacterium RM1_1_8]|nr:hypothetical protein [Synechococcales cyanobacterium RM1_1_8]
MKKLFWLSSFALALSLMQPGQTAAAAATATGLVATGTTAPSAMAIAPLAEVARLAAPDEPDPDEPDPNPAGGEGLESSSCLAPEVIAQNFPEQPISLLQAFGPVDIVPLPPESCHRQMDPVSRQLFLAVLTQADRLGDPAHKAQALFHLADTYKAYGLPQALPMLDYGLQFSRAIADHSQQLALITQATQLYPAFLEREAALPRERKAMDHASQLITQLYFDDGNPNDSQLNDLQSGDAPTVPLPVDLLDQTKAAAPAEDDGIAAETDRAAANGHEVYQVAQWYLQQGSWGGPDN